MIVAEHGEAPLRCDTCGELATSYLHYLHPGDTERAGCDEHPVLYVRYSPPEGKSA